MTLASHERARPQPDTDLRQQVAEELVKVTNRWVAPNFPAGWKLREFAELDEREQRLNLEYADAALAVVLRHQASPHECRHQSEKLSDGPRVPLRWGSAPTQICQCGMYRTMHHKPGRWLPGPPNTEPDPEV